MPDIGFLLKVSRPRFWLYVFGPYLVGLACAAAGRADFFEWKSIIYGLYFLFPANLLIYGVNDIFDYETDKLNEKKQEYEALVQPRQHKYLFLIIAVLNLPFIIASVFIAFNAIWAMIGFLFFSVFYSAPPIRAKTKPFLDSMFNILYIFPGIFAYQMLAGENPPWSIIFAAGIWTMAMHAYSAIPDIEADRRANLKTIATELGAFGTHIFCLVLYIISAALVYQYIGILSVLLGIAYVIMILLSLQFGKTNQVFKIYKFFPVINSAAGFFLFWYVVLSKFYL